MKNVIPLLVTIVFSAEHCSGWDIPGHMIVAQVAHNRLNPNAASHLAQAGAQLDFNGHHYNPVNIAGWADEIKHAHGVPEAGHFKQWHFIDLGCPDSHFELLTNA